MRFRSHPTRCLWRSCSAEMRSSGEKIDELFYAGTPRYGKRIFANASEPCFLKHANRAEIVLGDVRTQWPRRLKAKELRHSSGGDTSAPELTTDPIAYESVVGCGIGPCANVSDNLVARDNGAAYGGGIAEDIGGPMGKERISIPRRECGELGGLGIELMNEEDREIVSLNRTE